MRPTKYSQRMFDEAQDYIDNYSRHGHAIPSAVGLCKVLGVSRSTIYKWGDEYEAFSDVLDALHERQELVVVNKSITGDYNSTISKLILTKHGYSDGTDSDVNFNGQLAIGELSRSEAKAISDELESEC